MSNDEIGGRIRSARKERGLTQDGLAAAVGVTRSAVAQWETARAGQVTDNLSRIASALGINVEWLIHGDDKRVPLNVSTGDEAAMLRLYRECAPEDRQFVLRTLAKLAKTARQGVL